MKLSDEVELAGRLISSRYGKEIEIIAVKSGQGKIQSASATQLIIDRYEPDILIDAGGAGALSPILSVFDIVCAEYTYEYDIIAIEEYFRLHDDLTTSTILAELSEKGRDILHQFAEKIESEKSIDFAIGNVISGERRIDESKLREKLHTAFQAVACNWESSAVLRTAQLNRVKAMSFRVLTDNASEGMSKELEENWNKALSVLYPVLEEFILGGWLTRILGSLQKEK